MIKDSAKIHFGTIKHFKIKLQGDSMKKKLLSILGATFAIPLLVHADLQPPTASPTEKDTTTQTMPKVGSKSPETAKKAENKDEKTVDDSMVNEDAPAGPVIPPSNNINDSPGP